MRHLFQIVSFVSLSMALIAGGCKSSDTNPSAPPPTAPQNPYGAAVNQPTISADVQGQAPSGLAAISNAIAVVRPLGDGKVSGKVTFTQTTNGVAVVADISGLTPGKHGFHIHEYADCSDPKGMGAGGHYNPEGEMHGLPGAAHHHPGDMGNLEADADGNAHLEVTLSGVTIAGEKDPILGRSIIIHAKEDDGGQPVGNAGGRVACGIIGVAKGS